MLLAFLAAGLVCCAIAVTVLGYLVIQTQIEVKAMLKSTHQIQYIPASDFEKLTEATKEKLEKEFFDNLQ